MRNPFTAARCESAGDRRQDRGTATTLSYVLTLGITALLISGLIAAAGGTVDRQREDTAREAMEVVGQQLASRLMAADRLAESGASDVTIRGEYPETLAGVGYTITVTGGSPTTIELSSAQLDITVTVTAATRTPVSNVSVSGGDVDIVLVGGELEVQSS